MPALHFHRTLDRERARVRMNVAADQEKENNEKTGKRKAVEERKQAADYKEAALLWSFRGSAAKKWFV